MKLTEEEKRDFLADGKDPARREHFRAGRHPQGPLTFDAFIEALDDLQAYGVQPLPRIFIAYSHSKL